MPISYKIDRDLFLLSMQASGTITESDILEYRNALQSDPDREFIKREICDLRGAEIGISWKRMDEMAQYHGDLLFSVGTTMCAVVVSGDVLFGLVNMYAQQPGRHGHTVLPFRDIARAREWLGLTGE